MAQAPEGHGTTAPKLGKLKLKLEIIFQEIPIVKIVERSHECLATVKRQMTRLHCDCAAAHSRQITLLRGNATVAS